MKKGMEDGSWKIEVTIRGKKNFQTEESVEKKQTLCFLNLYKPLASLSQPPAYLFSLMIHIISMLYNFKVGIHEVGTSETVYIRSFHRLQSN